MFGKLGDMMGKLHEMKQKAEEVKEKLSQARISVEGAGGDIKLTISGDRKLTDLQIAPALQHGDKLQLEKELLATINRALADVEKLNEEEMKKAAGGLLPGM
jgi:DNA-binding YbaB/EbfC family protein